VKFYTRIKIGSFIPISITIAHLSPPRLVQVAGKFKVMLSMNNSIKSY